MFTSHPSKPTNSDEHEFYMTQIKGWSLTSDLDTFRQGATWYRNGRDWAKEQRDDAIRRANERATSNVVESTMPASVRSAKHQVMSRLSQSVENHISRSTRRV